MKTNIFTLLFILFSAAFAFSQNGGIKGRISDGINNEALPFVNIIIQGTTTGTTSDIDGNFEFKNLKPGVYNLTATFVGYEPVTVYEVEVNGIRPSILDLQLKPLVKNISGVEVKSAAFTRKEESPISMRTIGANELSRSPGGNRDISKVIQSLPGVAPTVSFRNDIIIRGGAPNENRFYIDGIEVPNINHFATQGSSGGPVGMINVDFIREVELYSSAFPSNRGNALSSVMEFKLKDGRNDKFGGKFSIGASDIGLMLEGPLNRNATFMVAARRSYLEFLFKALGLPFLPTYNDFQLKYKWKPNSRNEISILGLGAIDNFKLNTKLQESGTDQQKYILGYLPVSEQWNYMLGARYVHYFKNSYLSVVASRNMLNNSSYKYEGNEEAPDKKIQDYLSQEIENKFRIEHTLRTAKNIKINYGANLEYNNYNNSTYNRITTPYGVDTINFSSKLNLWKWGLFGQISMSFFNEKLGISAGLRTDANDFDKSMRNPLNQLSPVISLTYNILPGLSVVANTGLYYQLPPYTVMGYRNGDQIPVNKFNNITYIRAHHVVAGVEYLTKWNMKLSAEGFVKFYDKYPFLVRDSIALANLGSDFGIIGNDEVASDAKGRSYGFEFLVQQKLFKGFYGLLTYTYVRSEFKDKYSAYRPSSWDNTHILNITLGKSFKHNWDVGLKWRFAAGSPYTPYDIETSRLIYNWNINNRGVADYDLLNSERLPAFHNLDLRVDKKFFWKFLTLGLYIDIQNVYNFKTKLQPLVDVVRDDQGNPLIDPADPERYQARYLENPTGTILPSVGIIIEF